MQTNLTKKMVLLVPFLLWWGGVFGQTAEALLQQADTLFRARRYAESLRTYEQILQGSGQATPAMLLRMAFIEEGLGRYTEALYYLNLYYRRHPRQAVAVKMEDIAARHNLAGYQFSDLDFFFIWYDRYYDYLMGGLLLLSLLLLALAARKKMKGRFVLIRHGVGLIFILLLNVALLNLHSDAAQAIVHHDGAYLMNAPSAGARLVHIVPKGNRLDISDRQDIWLKTEWNGRPAYVRHHQVLVVR
jgi:tetratricopeptide (TPR) repeat protein